MKRKRTFKRVVSILLCAIMALSAVPMSILASAAGTVDYSEKVGEGNSSSSLKKVGVRYVPSQSGQILKPGKYYIYNASRNCVFIGSSDSNGINASQTLTLSGDTLTTTEGKTVTVTVADASKNLYYFQTESGKYIKVKSSTTWTSAVLSDTPVVLKAVVDSSKPNMIGIAESTGTYFLNAYAGTAYGVYNEGLSNAENQLQFFTESIGYTEYRRYTPKTSGQRVENGNYFIFSTQNNGKIMTNVIDSTNKGIDASSNYTLSSNSTKITASTDYLYTITRSGTSGNNYYIKNKDGKYLTIGTSTTLDSLTLGSSSSKVAISTNTSYPNNVVMKNTSSDYYVNQYNNETSFGVWSNGFDDPNNRLTLYKETAEYFTLSSAPFTMNAGDYSDTSFVPSTATIYKQTSASASRSEYSWSDSRVTIDENGFEPNVAGEYLLKVRVDGVLLGTIPVNVVEGGQSIQQANADPSTSDLRSQFRGVASDDGKILTDKTVRSGTDEFGVFSSYEDDEFSVALSALGQSYQKIETVETEVVEKVHPDVVFVLDASGSMRQFTVSGSNEITRAEATAEGLNSAIKELYAADPETRIGIVTYGFGIYSGVYLPLDKYTLPAGQTDYITWNGRMVASGSGTINDGHSYPVRTVSAEQTVSNLKSLSTFPGYQPRGGSYSYYRPSVSELTKITTVNGITYYAAASTYGNEKIIYIYTDTKEAYVAILFSSPTSTYTNVFVNDDIKITYDTGTSLKYTTNTYTNRSSNIKLSFESEPYLMATNFLINSNGQVVRPSSHHFVMGIGTFTQAGLQKAENMFADVSNKENRIPTTVLISDGIPTVSDTNTTTPHLEQENGVTVGYGLTASGTSSNELSSHGLRTIETAISTKQTVSEMYTSVGSMNSLMYIIGPGVDYIFGQTILDPKNENIEAARKVTSNRGQNSESGVGVPSDLAKMISDKYTDLSYVDYADWSYMGDLSLDELTTAFRRIATAITSVTRPVAIKTSHTTTDGNIFAANAAMIFTDNIGEGMEVRGAPVIVYNNKSYTSTSSAPVMYENGTNSIIYSYNYSVTEPSTRRNYTLNGLVVEVLFNNDSTQTVKWYIPADLVPVIVHDVDKNTYTYADPIRAVYKVGLADDEKGGTYYTNSTDDIATAEFTPTVGNSYYYNNVKDPTDGQMHSYLKSDVEKTTPKTQNITSTDPDSSDISFDNDGNATVELGNNGKIVVKDNDIKLSYDLYLVDENGNPVDENGNRVSFENRVVMSELQEIIQTVGSSVEIDYDKLAEILPEGYYIYSPDAEFTQNYTSTGANGITDTISDTTKTTKVYDPSGASVSSDGTVTGITDHSDVKVTFAIAKIPDIKLSYDLYLVDENGNPVDENGNRVSFDNRVVMSELQEVLQDVGSNVEIDYDELLKILPEGYYIYSPDASFTQNYTGTGANGITDKISDTTSTTKVYDPATAQTGPNGVVTGITDYSDIKVTFAIAKIPELKVSYDLYLVDGNGNPVDENGNPVSFEDRVVMSDLQEITQNIGSSVEIDYDELAAILPEGYYIYNPDSEFTQNYTSTGANGVTDTISDTTKTTKVYDPATAKTDPNGNVTGITDHSEIKVTFAIVKIPDIKVGYDLYLVDNNGNPVDENGNRVSFENRVVMSDLQEITQSIGSNVEIGYDELAEILPDGYYIYSPDAEFTQNYTSTGANGVTDTISDTTKTTKVYDPSGASVSSDGTVTGITDHSDVKVTFAIAKIPDIKLSYDLYLVDSNGNPVDENGNPVSFENRVVMSDLQEIMQSVGSNIEIGYDELAEILPDGYFIYNPNAEFTQNYTGLGENGVTDTISDTTKTTKVYDPATAKTGPNGTVTGITDHSDIKVTFAIAKLEILPDVIVVDYGKPILCSPLDNDVGAISIVGLGAMDSSSYSSSYTSQNGVFRISGNNVTFSPFSYMSSINRVRYYVKVQSPDGTKILSSTIYVIPATTVYYEDNFGGSDANGGLYIEYTGDWYTVDDRGTWDGDLSAKADAAEMQDRGEVGQGHTPYGYDSSYNGDTKFSDGTATVVEGSISGTGASQMYDASASFTFTGTGFDIISRTDLDCGLINVMVYDHSTGEFIDSVPVINKGADTLYQIPVISYTGVPYGTYDVVINVSSPISYLGITGSTFYLDAIRVYDPMGKESADNKEFDEANDAYNTDKEANAFIASIRDFIIQVDSLGAEESYGAVYVDTINNNYNEGGVIGNVKKPEYTDEQMRHRSMSEEELNTFELIGPNEEVYLTPGYGVGFVIESNILPESVQLEIKMPTPAKTQSQSVISVQTYGKASSQKNFSVKSATEMFYDITDAVQFTKKNGVYRATVVLSNGLPTGANANEIVSVTNIKMTYPDGVNVSNNFNFTEDSVDGSSLNPEQGTPEYAYNAEMEALAECGVAEVSLKASKEIYKQVFDTIYVQRIASTPIYDVVNAEISDSVARGEYADITFNTASFVDDVVLVDENGNEIQLTDVNCTVDESKRYTDDYLNTKTWTAKARLLDDEGVHEYTVKSADEAGETETVSVDITEAVIRNLSVKTAPEKTVYAYGEAIDTTGLELTAKLSDDTEKTITNGITFSSDVADRSGKMNITANIDGKETAFTVNVLSLVSASAGTVVDSDKKIVYGIDVNAQNITDYVESVDGNATVACTDGTVCTGSEINLLYGDETVDTYKAVIFGDVNGDGWYDGTDSVIVNCIANGLLSKEQVGEAVYLAADCNHDGVVDNFDVAVLEQAGVLIGSIDQTKTEEELASDSIFAEYVNLIAQSVEADETAETTETAPTQAEDTTSQTEQQTQSIFEKIVQFIIYIFKMIISYIPKAI